MERLLFLFLIGCKPAAFGPLIIAATQVYAHLSMKEAHFSCAIPEIALAP
jgi:hypothetical protein